MTTFRKVIEMYGGNSRKVSCDFYIDDRSLAGNTYKLLEGLRWKSSLMEWMEKKKSIRRNVVRLRFHNIESRWRIHSHQSNRRQRLWSSVETLSDRAFSYTAVSQKSVDGLLQQPINPNTAEQGTAKTIKFTATITPVQRARAWSSSWQAEVLHTSVSPSFPFFPDSFDRDRIA